MLTYMHMRWLEVCEYEPPFCPYHHPLFIFNLQQKIAHLFFLLESDHGLYHAWVTQAFLSSCLHYFSSYFGLKGYVWISFFICSSSQSHFCCFKLEIWRAPKSRGETKLKVSQSQVAESRLGSTLPASNSRKG
jgi:hypothetical protein